MADFFLKPGRKPLKTILIIAGVVLALALGYFVIYKNYTAAGIYQKGKAYYDNEQYDEAIQLFRKAAEQGYAKAQEVLGDCYYCGVGVPEDKTQGIAWYRKAAEQGNAEAQYSLGLCYYYGNGVPQSKSEALYWYRKSAAQGYSASEYWVRELESKGVR